MDIKIGLIMGALLTMAGELGDLTWLFPAVARAATGETPVPPTQAIEAVLSILKQWAAPSGVALLVGVILKMNTTINKVDAHAHKLKEVSSVIEEIKPIATDVKHVASKVDKIGDQVTDITKTVGRLEGVIGATKWGS